MELGCECSRIRPFLDALRTQSLGRVRNDLSGFDPSDARKRGPTPTPQGKAVVSGCSFLSIGPRLWNHPTTFYARCNTNKIGYLIWPYAEADLPLLLTA